MDALSDLLRIVRLNGAFFYAADAAGPWSARHDNNPTLDLASVAYWCQIESHKAFPPLADRAARAPKPFIGVRRPDVPEELSVHRRHGLPVGDAGSR